ncbi:MAG: BACON domain-containing protein [Prevotellaceae bacterium]|jgi:hypothetical protein|nr:BACON domain-containing protein [Prevotellaceae bacterium]
MKKHVLLLLCSFAAFSFAACEKTDNPPDEKTDNPPETPFLTVSPDTDILFPSGGGRRDIVVATNQTTWDAVSDREWCAIEKDGDKLTISAGENEKVNPKPDATVSITAGTLTRTITVGQEGILIPVMSLDHDGTSNCYIVTYASWYSFDATVIGNGAAGIIDPSAFHTGNPAITPVSAKLLWQDYYENGQGLITAVELYRNNVLFSTARPLIAGNALIAVCDANDNILWSWHIWIPSVAVAPLPSATGYEVMNLNLGALTDEPANPKSYGMLYQWGRKDPLPAAATLLGNISTVGAPIYDAEGQPVSISNSSWSDVTSNTLLYAIRNPTVCLSNNAQYASSRDWLKADLSSDALWGNPQGNIKDQYNQYVNKGMKSCYDPCPPGWRVPPADVFRNFTPSGGYEQADANDDVPFNVIDINSDDILNLADYNYGWRFYLDKDNAIASYFPAAARFDGQYAMLMGSMSGLWGAYWGNAPYTLTNAAGGGFSVLSFQTHNYNGTKTISASPAAGASRADAYSVRCIKD